MGDDFDNLHIDETQKNTDARSDDEESEDHHFDDCLDDFDECCADIRASERSHSAGSDDDERDNQEDMDQEPLCELEKNALEEYLRSVSSKGTDRQHDQLVSEDIDVRAARVESFFLCRTFPSRF